MRVVYWARIQLARKQIVEKIGAMTGIELIVLETLPEVLAALPGADAFLTYDAPKADAAQVVKVLDDPASKTKLMHVITAGREGFEAAGLPKKVTITYAAGAVSPAVAEHAMALLLAMGRRVPDMMVQKAAHQWDRSIATRAISLEGQTLAIIGFGHIGRELALRARAFGMKVTCVSRSAAPDPLLDEVYPMASLHEALGRADAVVIAIAMAAETRHLFDAKTLAACKRGALLVNIARGAIIDQAALRDALVSGQLGGAGLDVTDPEPLPADDPLWDAPNLVLSPHFAGGGSAASMRRLADGAAENLERFARGESLLHVVADGAR